MPAILRRTHGPELFAAMGRSYANTNKSIKPTSAKLMGKSLVKPQAPGFTKTGLKFQLLPP